MNAILGNLAARPTATDRSPRGAPRRLWGPIVAIAVIGALLSACGGGGTSAVGSPGPSGLTPAGSSSPIVSASPTLDSQTVECQNDFTFLSDIAKGWNKAGTSLNKTKGTDADFLAYIGKLKPLESKVEAHPVGAGFASDSKQMLDGLKKNIDGLTKQLDSSTTAGYEAGKAEHHSGEDEFVKAANDLQGSFFSCVPAG